MKYIASTKKANKYTHHSNSSELESVALMPPKYNIDILDGAVTIQPKLAIGPIGDKYEREADHVADQIMCLPVPGQLSTLSERQRLFRQPAGLPSDTAGPGLPEKPKSTEDKLKDAAKKVGEAFLKTKTGKQLETQAKQLGADFASTWHGKVITGAVAAGAATALITKNLPLPFQLPAIPLNRIMPGLSMRLTYEGPVRTPTKAMLTFTYRFGGSSQRSQREPDTSERNRISPVRQQSEAENQKTIDTVVWSIMNDPTNPLYDFHARLRQQTSPSLVPRMNQLPNQGVSPAKPQVSRKEARLNGHKDIPPLVQRVLARSGSPLDLSTRNFMEARFEQSFAGVRVHDSDEAAKSAQSIDALAYTQGNNIVFNSAQYEPKTDRGKRLLAHELTHVVQQNSGKENPGSNIRSNQVQRYTKVPPGTPYDLLADDGQMAVKDHARDAWAKTEKIKESNKVLKKIHSKVEIEELASKISVTPPGKPKAKAIELNKFRMKDKVTGTEASLVDDCGTACQEILGSDHHGSESFVAANKRGTTDEFTKPSSYRGDDNLAGGIISTTEQLSGEIYQRIFEREFKKTLSRKDALKAWAKLNATQQDKLSKKYGLNKYAVPKVGQGITIGSERDMPGAVAGGYNFHFGFALIASGADYITLEDYDSSGVKYYFDMYGPASKKQSWAEAPSNTGALGNKTTTMVVQHSGSLDGKAVKDKVPFAPSPEEYVNANKTKGYLIKDTKIRIMRKGNNWMKVEVKSGKFSGETGWILNRHFTN